MMFNSLNDNGILKEMKFELVKSERSRPITNYIDT